MKAIVFAAGIGSRLKPFTDRHPKALAPVAGKPALLHVIEKLVAAGADTVFVNVHHFASQIVDFLDSCNFGVPVVVSDESDMLLDTGGALAKLWRENEMLRTMPDNEPIIVHNSDIITDFPIQELAGTHGDAAVLADESRKSSRAFLFDKDLRLKGWCNTDKGITRPSGLDTTGLHAAAFGGVHKLSTHTLSELSNFCGDELHPFGIVDFYLDKCQTLDIRGFEPKSAYRWFDIGTPQKLAIASEIMANLQPDY